MIQKGRELTDQEKISVFDAVLTQTMKWTNCAIEEVDAKNYQGRCGRIGWDVRNILYSFGAIEKSEININSFIPKED